MSFGDDDDILQDFLVEAGEILEQLSEQLVDLEQSPDDKNLLNAIFRGFHTVKGGAGFLQLDEMVECCHITENLFDILRNGKRSVTPELMDVVLQALDAVNEQFRQISQREPATPASPELIAQLERLVSCDDLQNGDQSTPVESVSTEPSTTKPSSVNEQTQGKSATVKGGFDITDDEFEQFLDAINTPTADATTSTAEPQQRENTSVNASVTSSVNSAGVSDEISDDEFEKLLDQLHGKGKGPNSKADAGAAPDERVEQPSPTPDASQPKAEIGGSDEITDDEFEALLDELHGAGKRPSAQETAAGTSDSAGEPQASSASEINQKTTKKDSGKKPATTGTPGKGDVITDDEFEDLLDQLHGKGRGPSEQASVKETPKADAARSASVHKPASDAKAGPATVSNVEFEPKPAASAVAAAPAAETTVRVDTQRLDDIMNMVGELVLVRNRLVRLGVDSTDEVLSKAVGNLDVVTADLQSAVMKTRMQPIKKVFGRFPRVVRDLARSLKKEINLELRGEDTDLDKNLVEALADPLVHLVRNAVDHGIEVPADREAKGKPRVGKVVLSAEQEGDHILLAISDDGGGMDPEALRLKAIEKGILEADSAARLSDNDAFNLIFAPGFSTKSQISDVSGRGVGMDVVKTKITQLNGSIGIQSKLNEGTRIAIKVPLTLAIMPTLMVMVGNQAFALPLVSVNEIFHLDLTTTNVVDGQECVTVREKAIPIFHLKRWLIKRPSAQDELTEGHVVIVSIGTQRVGFVVDQLIGQEEVVIKPLGKMLHGTPGMAGATITGDGTIALILDVPGLLKRYAGRS